MLITRALTSFNYERYFQIRNIVMGIDRHYPMIIRKLLRIWVIRINNKFCSNIFTSCEGGALFKATPILPHGLCGIFIASTAHIGENCTILQQVTIGGNPSAFDGSAPISKAATIGNNVILSAGAKIIGNVRIGNNVIVGANAVVTHDVPDNVIVAGVPARIIKSNEK